MPKTLDERRAWAAALGAALAALAVWLSLSPSRYVDFWYHLKTGEIVARTWSIPRADPYSYVTPGRPWVTAAWLFEAVLYRSYSLGGAAAVAALRALAVAATFLVFFELAGAGLWAALLLAGAGLLDATYKGFFVERPQLFDYLFLGVVLRLLDRQKDEPPRPLWWQLPLVQAAWVNVHGGAALLGAAVTALKAATAGRGRMKWGGLALLCGLALFINPHGPRIITHLLATVGPGGKDVILEWQPVWKQAWRAAPLLMLAAGAALLPFSWRSERFLSLACLALGLMALSAVRHVALFSFAAAALGARVLERRFPIALGPRQVLAGVLAVGLVCAAAVKRSSYFASLGDVAIQQPAKPAADFLDKEGVEGRMFNSLPLGGYLLWRGRKVFIDGRLDNYEPALLRDAVQWARPEIWDKLERAWDFEYAVIENGPSYDARVLDESPRWALVFFDDAALVYVKREPRNLELIARAGYLLLKPNQLDYSYLSDLARDAKAAPRLLEEIGRAVKGSEQNANASMMRAFVLGQTRRPQEALREVEAVTRRFPDKPAAWMSLAWYHEQGGELTAARDYYERALEAAVRADDTLTQAFLYNNLGSMELRLGDRRRAEKMFRRCLELYPNHPQARRNLARLGARP